jgi:hypothetical protein
MLSALSPATGRSLLDRLAESSPYAFAIPITVLSFLFSGYIPINFNNIWHIPIIMKDYDLPAFRDDQYIQSLRYFASGFWLLFAGIGNAIDIRLFLFVGVVASHYLFFLAALHFARSLEYRDNRTLNLFLCLICAGPMTVGPAVGGGGILMSYFGHSELALVPLILSLSFALRRLYMPAVLAVCTTFFLNAFMGVWTALPLAFLVAYQLRQGDVVPDRLARGILLGAIAGAPLLAIPLVNILGNPDRGFVFTSPSYQDFLWSFWPYHFFITSLNGGDLFRILAALFGLFVTIGLHPGRPGPFLALSLGAAAILGAGALAPLVTDERMVLNLHLVRGFVVATILAGFSMSLAAAAWIVQPDTQTRRRLGPFAMGALLLPYAHVVLYAAAPLVFAFERFAGGSSAMRRLMERTAWRLGARAFLAVCLLFLPVKAVFAAKRSIGQERQGEVYARIGTWAARSTPADATFVFGRADWNVSNIGFSMTARRRIWFDGMSGAAVMWSPSYLEKWREREAVWMALQTAPDKKALAQQNGIDFLVLNCASDISPTPLHREDDICVYPAK